MENQQFFRFYDNNAAYHAGLFKDFLARNNVQYYSISHPDLAAPDFYLFLGLEISINGTALFDVTNIMKNATEELKRHNGVQECFQRLYSGWRKCVFAQGDYLEVNVA
jgi:hypothetical protein